MMRGWRRPALAWLALAVYLLPAPALAQATKAGVVTTLEGNVTAVRAVAPQPVALKFKDDVYLQDRVVTGEQSFARLLLGGKAVVSIRERSAVTVTEVPGRSTIDVESGKIALSVARDRMQPGEVINIKMPNAVAGVRGTVVIAEVSYAIVGGAQQANSNLAVLRGQVEAVHTNAAGAAIGTPVMVGAMQKFSATPTTASTGTFTVEQIGGIVQGLQSKGAADPGTASQAPARLEAVNTAVALLTALTGTSGSQAVQHLATGTSPEITTPSATTPEAKITEAGDITSSPVVPGGSPLPQLSQAPPAPMNMTSLPSGQSLLTFTGNEVQSSDGTPIVPTTDPLLSTTGFTISQQSSDDLVVAKSDANIALPGPLLKLTNTSVQAGDAFLSVAGHVTSTSPQPFINLDPTTVMAPGNLIEVVGPSGVLGLAGTLVQDTGGTIGAGGSIVSVSQGGTVTSTGQGALVQFNGTTATASSLLSVIGSGSSATLSGTLFSAQGGSLGISGLGLADISNGGRVTSSSTQPFVNIIGTALALPETTFVVSGGQLTVGGSLLRAESIPTMTSFGLLVDNGGAVTVGGPVFDFVNSSAAARIVLANGSVLTLASSPSAVFQLAGGSLSLGFIDLTRSARLVANIPDSGLVNLFHSSMTLSGSALARVRGAPPTGGSLLQIGTPTAASSLVSLAGGSTLALLTNAALLSVTDGSAAQIFGSLISFVGTGNTVTVDNNLCLAFICATVNGVKIARGASVLLSSIRIETDPISGLAGNTLTVGDDDALILIDGANSRLLIAGTGAGVPDVVVDDTFIALSAGQTLKTLSGTSVRGGTSPVIFIRDSLADGQDATLVVADSTANATLLAGPLMKITNSTLDVARLLLVQGTLISLGASPLIALDPVTINAQTLVEIAAGGNLSLGGPLLTDLGGTVSTKQDAIIIAGSLTSTGAAALVGLQGTNLAVARQLVEVGGTPASSMNLSGPLLSATNTTIRTGNPAANPFGLVSIVDSATVTSTASAPFVSFVNSTVDLAGTVVTVRRSASVAAPTSLTLSGPLFFASDSRITTTSLGFDAFFGTTGQTCCSVVSIRQGARLVTTADQPLIQLASSTLNDGPDDRSGGTIFSLQDNLVGTTGELTAPASASLAGQLLTATNSNISALFNIITITNSTLTSTTTSPLVALSGGALTLGGANPLAAGALTFARGLSLSGAGAVLSLQGPLFAFSSMNATITGELLGVFNSSLLTDTTTHPLIQLSGGTFTTGPTANFMSIASSAGLSPSMQLAGPLLSATNATLRNGDPTTFVPQTLSTLHAFTFIGDSAQVRSTSTQPLFDFNGVSLTSSASVMSLRRSLTTAAPTRVTLDGPLLRALNNTTIDVTSLALGSACCSAFDVEQAAQLVSTTTTALIQLAGSVINAGPDAQSGGTLFLVSDSGLADGPIVASPARVTLNGPLISSVNSKLSSLFSLVGVGRSTLTSTSLDPLIQLTGFKDDLALQIGGVDPFVALPNNQTRTGRVLNVVASATTATVGDAALVSLAGPLLSAVQTPIQLTGDVIGVFNGAKVDSTSTKPFLLLSGEATALVAGAIDPGSSTVVDGRLAFVAGTGGLDGVTPASLTLSGPFLRQEAGSIVDTNSRGLTLLTDGALVTRAPPTDTTYPLLQVDASSLSVGSTSRTGVLLEVTGSGALAADPQTNPVTGGPSGLQFGQQRPLQHNGRGALLEASNSAFVNIRGANGTILRLDTALLDATAPIFLLTTAARVQTSGNGIDLVRNARLQASNASDAVVRIDSQARMDVLNGHLASVSASRLNVAGDLVRMGSNSLLNVTNGVLLSVLNGGIANINGALVAFTGANGLINVTNTLAPTTFIAGIPVNVAPGGNIAIGQGALAGLNVNGNTIRINGTALPTGANANSGLTGSLISVGANGTVRVGGGLN
jgi:hypothetical protein